MRYKKSGKLKNLLLIEVDRNHVFSSTIVTNFWKSKYFEKNVTITLVYTLSGYGIGETGKFNVAVDLHQGSALRPYLFLLR